MYKSPIELFYKDIKAKQEEYVLSAIQEMGVNVDKEELLKALKYDREQYSKGYIDGVKEFAERCKDLFLEEDEITRARIDNLLKEMVGEDK